jgi:hypothetical protein
MLHRLGEVIGISKDTRPASGSTPRRARPPSVPAEWQGLPLAKCKDSASKFPCVGSACVEKSTRHQAGVPCQPFYDRNCSDTRLACKCNSSVIFEGRVAHIATLPYPSSPEVRGSAQVNVSELLGCSTVCAPAPRTREAKAETLPQSPTAPSSVDCACALCASRMRVCRARAAA